MGFFNQANTVTPCSFIPPRLWKPKATFSHSRGSFAAPLRRYGLLQWGAVVLFLWLPNGNVQLPPAFADLCGQSSSGADTCATLQDTPGMLKEDVQPQPVLDYEALLARQGKGQHTVTNTDLHFLVMLCRFLLWSSDNLVQPVYPAFQESAVTGGQRSVGCCWKTHGSLKQLLAVTLCAQSSQHFGLRHPTI